MPKNLPLHPVFLIAVFLIASAAILHLDSRHHPDETFYSEAALIMERSGDYITPRYASGDLRFQKPVLAYWTVIAGHKLLGIHYFSTRLGFLLASGLVLVMTYQIGMVIAARRDVACLGVAMLMCNLDFMNTSIRSTADALQLGFIALALYGLARLALSERAHAGDAACWYLGLGLAVATKGFLAVLLLVYGSIVWPLLRRRLETPATRLPGGRWHVVAAIGGLAVALGWYIAVYVRWGQTALDVFFGDQVGNRLDGLADHILDNIITYPTGPFVYFMPFTAAILIASWGNMKALKEALHRRRWACWLTLPWLGLLIAIFMFGNISRSRYLIIAYPLLAPLLADILLRLATRAHHGGSRLQWWTSWPVLAPVLPGLAFILIGLRAPDTLRSGLIVGGLLLSALGIGAYLWNRRLELPGRLVVVGVLILVAYRGYDLTIGRTLNPSPVPGIADLLAASVPADADLLMFVERRHAPGVHKTLPARLRIVSGDRYDARREWSIDPLPASAATDLPGEQPNDPAAPTFSAEELNTMWTAIGHADAILLATEYADGLVPPGYTCQPAGVYYLGWKPKHLLRLATSPDPDAYLATRRTPYTLATRNQ